MPNSEPSRQPTFDLPSIAEELRQTEPYRRDGHSARSLVRAADLRVLLIAIQGRTRIAEHHANESVSVHAISGHVRVHVPDGTIELPAGRLLCLERGIKHDVEATVDSAFVLTLGWRGEH